MYNDNAIKVLFKSKKDTKTNKIFSVFVLEILELSSRRPYVYYNT